MITKFKIFESKKAYFEDEDDLMKLFSQKFIEEFFDNYYEVSEEDAARMLNLWDYVDIDIVRDSLIGELADYSNIEDKKYKKEDFIDYIKNKMKDINISLDDLKNMSRKKLIEIITNEGEEKEFLLKYFKEDYEEVHPKQILIDINGKFAIENPESLLYYLREYLDENEIINAAADRIHFDFKYEYLRDYICNSEELQEKLLELNPNAVNALFDVMDDDRSIGTTYEFQKKYIEFKVKEDGEDIIPETLKDIHDKFGLNSDIEDEYKDYTYLISAEKYNL